MTAEQETFLECLKDYIHCNKTMRVSDNVKKEDLYQYAKLQDLAPVFYEQCKNCLGMDHIVGNLKNSFLSAVFFYSLLPRTVSYDILQLLDGKTMPCSMGNAGMVCHKRI